MLFRLIKALFFSSLSKVESKEEATKRALIAKLITAAQLIPILLGGIILSDRNLFAPEVPDSLTLFPIVIYAILILGAANILARRKHFLSSILLVNLLVTGIILKVVHIHPSVLSFSISVNFAVMALVFSSVILNGKQSLIPAVLQITAIWTCYLYSVPRNLPADAIIILILFHVICVFLYFSMYLKQRNEASFRKEIENNAKSSQIGFMAAGIAHEINNPLTILTLNSIMLERDLQKMGIEYPKQRFEHIFNASERVHGIIRNVRELAKDSYNHQRNLIPLKKIEAFLNEQKNYYFEKHPEIEFISNVKDHNTLVTCNEIELFQVLTNLIKNGIEALDEHNITNPKLEISIEASFREIIFQIRDNGPGFPKDVLNNMGSIFNSHKENGIGLGLSITHNIVKINKGNIFLESTDEGSRFTIEFQRHREAELVLKTVDKFEDLSVLNVYGGYIIKTPNNILHALLLDSNIITQKHAKKMIEQLIPFLGDQKYNLIVQRRCSIEFSAMKLLAAAPFTENVISSSTVCYSMISRITHRVFRRVLNKRFPVESAESFEKAFNWTQQFVQPETQFEQKNVSELSA